MVDWDTLFRQKKYIWTKPNSSVIRLVPLLKKRKIKRILDLGCGAGRHIVYLTKRGFFVVGLDVSATALKLSQDWLKKEKIKNYCLIEHDMIKLPFPKGYYDAIISINVIHHSPLNKIKKTVSEIRRVLRKKGIALLTISSTKDYKFRLGKRLEKNTYLTDVKTPDAGVIHHFFNEDSTKKLFSKFKILDLKEIEEQRIVHRKKVKNVHWKILVEKDE